MADFDTVLSAYLKQEAGLEALNQALAEYLSASPDAVEEVRRRLDSLRAERKLTIQEYGRLELLLARQQSRPAENPQAEAEASDRKFWREAAYWQSSWPSSPPPKLQLDKIVEGNYRLLQAPPADSQDWLETWEALDLQAGDRKASERRVALHFLPAAWSHCPQAIKHFLARFEHYRALRHPNLCPVYDAGHSGNRIFIATGLALDTRLDRIINKYPTGLPLAEVEIVARQLASACDYALRQGLSELFLRPDNVYYDPVTRQLKILDFGLDLLADGVRMELGDAEIPPSRAYRSCESLAGGGSDPRDCTYALACLSYELLAGQHPFGGKTANEARDKQFMPSPVKNLKKPQWQALRQGLQWSRKEREWTPAGFSAALFPAARRSWPVAAVLAVALAGGVAWGGYAWWQAGQNRIKAEQQAQIQQNYQSCLSLAETPLHDRTPCFLDTRKALAELNPQHPLLSDPRLPAAYRDEAQKLIDSSAYQSALGLLQDWATLLPETTPERDSLRRIVEYSQRIESHLQGAELAEAAALIKESRALYPAVARFSQHEADLASRKAARLQELQAKYQGYREQGVLLPSETTEDLFDTRQQILALDPQSPLLRDASLHTAFFDKVVETASRDGDTLDRVKALFAAWRELFSNPAYFQAADQETRDRAVNRVALRYLLKAGELRTAGDNARAKEYLEFALSLEPVQSVKDKLSAELAAPVSVAPAAAHGR